MRIYLQFQRAEKLTPKKRRIRKQLFLHELIPSVSTCPWCAKPGCHLSLASVLQITFKSQLSSVTLLKTCFGRLPSRCMTLIHGLPCLPQPLSPACSESLPVLWDPPALPSHCAAPVPQQLSAWPQLTVGPGWSVLESGALLWHCFHS